MRTQSEGEEPGAERFRWDWIPLAVALVIVSIFVLLTFEFWISHDFLPQR